MGTLQTSGSTSAISTNCQYRLQCTVNAMDAKLLITLYVRVIHVHVALWTRTLCYPYQQKYYTIHRNGYWQETLYSNTDKCNALAMQSQFGPSSYSYCIHCPVPCTSDMCMNSIHTVVCLIQYYEAVPEGRSHFPACTPLSSNTPSNRVKYRRNYRPMKKLDICFGSVFSGFRTVSS